MLKSQITVRVAMMLLAAMLIGCKATPAPNAGFADASKLTAADPSVPFNRFWKKPNVDWSKYERIYVADVNTAYMMKLTDYQKGERQGEIEKDVQNVAAYARDSVKKALRDDPKHRFKVIDQSSNDPHGLVLEIALIEIVPSKVLLNAAGYAPFFIGAGITVVRTAADDKSYAAFEARVRDAETGEIVMLAADRETQQFAPIDVRGLTWYSDVEGMIDDWSRQAVQIANSKPGEKVEGTSTFRLLPW